MSINEMFNFELPVGYKDGEGNIHKEGVMRRAKAADEIKPLRDPRAQSNPVYLVIILLSKVIVSLGSLRSVTPDVIENLYSKDLAYLQDFYNRLNGNGSTAIKVQCPHCQKDFYVEPESVGE